MFCGPKTDEQPFSGFWDHLYECKCKNLYSSASAMLVDWPLLNEARLPFALTCVHSFSGNKSWANPPESCDDYEGQKAGRYDQSKPYANSGEVDIIVFL